MGNKAVVARVGHGCVEETVDDQRTRLLVHFILDRLPTEGDFNKDVDVVRRIVADGYGIDAHCSCPWCCAGCTAQDDENRLEALNCACAIAASQVPAARPQQVAASTLFSADS